MARVEGDLLSLPTSQMSTPVSDALESCGNPGFVAGQSRAIESVNVILGEIACSNIPVLLIGESGTGKDVYARLLYRLSGRCQTPIRKLSCRAVQPEDAPTRMRSILKERSDSIETGAKTVFLDAIDDLDLTCQKILLSLLPDGDPEENGNPPVRLMTSASRNLDREIDSGRFRKELFFRVSGACLRLPALRERKEDIPLFLKYFLAKYARELQREIPQLGDEEFELLGRYNWPGNVRELENVTRKICLFGHAREAIQELGETSRIGLIDPSESQNSSLKVAARRASRQAERELIREALERTHWNRKRAAEELKISYKSLLYKIKQTGLLAS